MVKIVGRLRPTIVSCRQSVQSVPVKLLYSRRPTGRRTTIAVALIALVAASAAGSAATADGRPNEVLVNSDDQGCGDLSCHGNPLQRAPALDRLHNELVRLADDHAVPCSPTGTALMTGHRTNRTAVWHASGGRSSLLENEVATGQGNHSKMGGVGLAN